MIPYQLFIGSIVICLLVWMQNPCVTYFRGNKLFIGSMVIGLGAKNSVIPYQLFISSMVICLLVWMQKKFSVFCINLEIAQA